MMFWLSLILSHETIDDFLKVKMTHSYATALQKELASLTGQKTSDSRDVIWEKMKIVPYLGIMSHSQLARFLKNIDAEKWDKTLMIFNKIHPNRKSLTKNLAKEGGFEANELKRIYAITPNGDKDWKKWAKLIPKESMNKWDEWDTLKDKNGNQIPGNGKMVRIK